MKATVKFGKRNNTYDTETSTLIGNRTFGEFGDPTGYEINIYKTKNNLYFLVGIGGAESPYPTETLEPLKKDEALGKLA